MRLSTEASFLIQQTIQAAVEENYIPPPSKYSPLERKEKSQKKHFFLTSVLNEPTTGAILAVVFFAFSFFLGLCYATRSLVVGLRHHRFGKISLKAIPKESSNFMDTQAPLDVIKKKFYEESYCLRQKMRNERLSASFCQFVMTVGAGFLTATFIAALCCQGRLPFFSHLAYTGTGLIALGAMGYLAKVFIFKIRTDRLNSLSIVYN